MGKKYGVSYQYGVEVDENLIKLEKLDAIILATGAVPVHPNIKGINGKNVVDAVDVIDAKCKVGRNCLIAGGGMVGAETADILREHVRIATIIDLLPGVAMDTVLGIHDHLMERLNQAGTQYILNAKIQEFTENGVIYEQNGELKSADGFDNIILALGSKAYNPLETTAKELVQEVYVIGDAIKPGKANTATEAAMDLANRI